MSEALLERTAMDSVVPMKAAPKAQPRLRVAAYCRVSTDQEEQTNSFENQVTYYKEKITANPEWAFAGIYADEGISGTDVSKRAGFQKMLKDCRAGKIDRVMTKSISRFARNVIDSLKYTRELKALGISIDFEEEHINSMDAGAEMIFTILSAVAEQESRNISEHTKWGIRAKYKQGSFKNTTINLIGYKDDGNGKAIIDEKEAGTVRLIFQNFLEGMSYGEIAKNLNLMGVPGKKGSKDWNSSGIQLLLKNEKYKGDVALQKSYVPDFMAHRTVKNNGELEKFYFEDEHPAIIERQTWDAVQEEIERRNNLKDVSGKTISFNSRNPYTGKVMMKGGCRAVLQHRSYSSKGGKGGSWKCQWAKKTYNPVCHDPVLTKDAKKGKYPACPGFSLNDRIVQDFFRTAWNSIIDGDLKKTRLQWTAIENDECATSLQRIRAKQMLKLTSTGEDAKIQIEVPELTKMVLDRIEVEDPRNADVYFLDGTVKQVTLKSEYDWEE